MREGTSSAGPVDGQEQHEAGREILIWTRGRAAVEARDWLEAVAGQDECAWDRGVEVGSPYCGGTCAVATGCTTDQVPLQLGQSTFLSSRT